MYKQTQELAKEGVRTISVDEKTGIQALQRNAPDLVMKVGQVHRREFEYTRHGTQCLIANFDVASGKIIAPTVSDTRTEQDFVNHIEKLIQSDPLAQKWRIVCDQLNTHLSESLVRLVAGYEKIKKDTDMEVGQKEKSGILKSQLSRKTFLQNEEHFITFIYTPTHCSWLNQIEIWFAILYRKILRRGNFLSKQDLKDKILNFIDYFNTIFAKPFKWTFTGIPLKI